MREAADTATGDLLPGFDLAGECPAPPSTRERTAVRLAKMRTNKNLAAFTVNIPAELKTQFDEYLTRTNKGRSEVIAHLLRTQVLRKR
jgi:hypothetical protein